MYDLKKPLMFILGLFFIIITSYRKLLMFSHQFCIELNLNPHHIFKMARNKIFMLPFPKRVQVKFSFNHWKWVKSKRFISLDRSICLPCMYVYMHIMSVIMCSVLNGMKMQNILWLGSLDFFDHKLKGVVHNFRLY